MQKAHSNIDWKNFPNLDTPLNEQNLNKMDVSIDTIDDRVIYLDTSKLDKTDAESFVKKIEFDRATGVFTITYFSGATTTIDTMLEKLAVNFTFDPETQILSVILDDGSTIPVDLSALITQYEFLESETIAFQVDQSGKVSAIVKNGSITEKHLRPDYLADIRVEVSKAENERTGAENARESAEDFSKLSESYAHGDTGMREGEDSDNAKEYARQAKESAEKAAEIAGGKFVPLSDKGKAGGVATLDDSRKVPKDQLPEDIGEKEVSISQSVPEEKTDLWVNPDEDSLSYYDKESESYKQISSGGGGAVDSVNGQTGVVELTAKDVKAVAIEGDTADNTITFTSNDTIDADATSWTSVSQLATGITHATFAQRISQMFKNVRYLYKMLGTTDISNLGDGTVTGALDELNSNLIGGDSTWVDIPISGCRSGSFFQYKKKFDTVYVRGAITTNSDVGAYKSLNIANLPDDIIPKQTAVMTCSNVSSNNYICGYLMLNINGIITLVNAGHLATVFYAGFSGSYELK